MHHKKAETLLTFLIIIQCKYNGDLSESHVLLMTIPEVGEEKVAVVLNSLGLYDRVGLGPGFNSHMHKYYKSVMEQGGFDENVDKWVVETGPYFPVHPGVDAK